MKLLDLPPRQLLPVNPPVDRTLSQELTRDMMSQGWRGRPLLVEEVTHPVVGYYAWTGSHRIAAAREAGLPTVPCLVMGAGEADSAFALAGYSRDARRSWGAAVIHQEGGFDEDEAKRRALVRAGLVEAATLMAAEELLEE